MKHAHWNIALRMCIALGLAAAAGATQSQALRKIGAAPQPAAPAAATNFGLPNPTGLPSTFPAGLPSPTTAGTTAVTVPGTPVTGRAGALNDPALAVQTNVIGASAGGGVGLPRLAAGAGASGRFSAVEIARSFIEADGNRDGELTRAEAARLAIVPYSFEEMDRNRDGILSRFEYEDATR